MSEVKAFLRNHFFNLTIALILCGRFYFVFGFTGMLKPIAGYSVIFFRDVLFLFLVAITGYLYLKDFRELFNRYKVAVIGLAVLFASIVALHAISKPYEILAQHYVRNIFLYTLMIPVVAILLKNRKINIHIILNSFLLVNLIFSVVQLIWLPGAMLDESRPLGVVGDPIVSSLFNYFFIFKMLFEKLNIYKLATVVIACVCLDAQASVTALACVGLAAVFAVTLDFEYYKKYFVKLLSFIAIFSLLTFIDVRNNDLSDRILTAIYGTVGRHMVGVYDARRNETFEHLSRERLKVIRGNNLFSNRITVSEDLDEAVATRAGETQKDSYLVGEQSLMTVLFGDFYQERYYIVDSNLVSIFKNLGLLSLIIYYWCLAYIVWLAYKLNNQDSRKVIFFTVSVLWLGLFCATIYKYPIMLCAYLYFGYLLEQQTSTSSQHSRWLRKLTRRTERRLEEAPVQVNV